MYTRSQLIQEYNAEPTAFTFLLFWGHQASKDGTITKSCFSQWWPAPFEIEGIIYPTAEHYMMAEKARLFKDTSILESILNTNDPKEVKALGRKILNFDSQVWEEHKYQIVKTANSHKFNQNPDIKVFLCNTEQQILVEASPYDRVWGIGLSANDALALDPNTWNGENLLGFALMEVRDELIKNPVN